MHMNACIAKTGATNLLFSWITHGKRYPYVKSDTPLRPANHQHPNRIELKGNGCKVSLKQCWAPAMLTSRR